MAANEIFPIVDTEGNVVGSATRSECHSGSKLLHPVVHLHIFNSDCSKLYLQKRSLDKDIQPGKWDTSVGGHVDYGEEIEQALMRETREELGLTGFEPTLLYRYIFESMIECEMVNTYETRVNEAEADIKPDPVEISEGRFWSIGEIKDNLGKSVFTPNFEMEFERLCKCKSL